ncbi:MAG: hypothetical protein WD876_02110 [Candidatus Pacearchaeota archaeon]
MKPKYLYHGGGKELEGEKLIPTKATDLGKNPDNLYRGVYASDVKNDAIAMGILSCKGVRISSCGVERKDSTEVEAIIYNGWPEQDFFYLYVLPSETFRNRPNGSHQWVSLEAVKPLKVEKLLVKDYLYLVRRASEKERNDWDKKFGKKLK